MPSRENFFIDFFFFKTSENSTAKVSVDIRQEIAQMKLSFGNDILKVIRITDTVNSRLSGLMLQKPKSDNR